ARDQVWEVPSLFQLPVTGRIGNKKWVLSCGMGPNKIQYFVGEFNGTTFTMDAASEAYLTHGTGLEGDVYADFETSYSGWSVQGDAFGDAPVAGAPPISSFLGSKLASSYPAGDRATGKLTSPTFTITRNCINFLIGGGNHPGETCINLFVTGNVV